jgi:hypothetical protein
VIFGAPRSGTTYLTQILNRHPDVFITYETRVFLWAHQSLNVLPQEDQFVFAHRDRFVEYLRDVYAGLIREFYRTLSPDTRFWGDKNPHYADLHHQGCLELIADLYPGAKFIHLVRDGRDVVASIVRNGWVPFDVAHRLWVKSTTVACTFGASRPTSEYFELRYEDLVADDTAVARDLLAFLGLDLHPDVRDFCDSQKVERTPFQEPMRDLTKGATSSEWAVAFDPATRLRSLELIGRRLVELGYETAASLAELQRALAPSFRPAGPE